MPETTEIKIQVDKTQLDKHAAARIAELEHKLDLAEKREARAKVKIAGMESELSEDNKKAKMLDTIYQEIKDEFFWDEYM